ncbi:hypothetical protein B0H13DRAFT_1906756 [Mycena leptocephala]|nr:hypothetical protein B0H13DRAFT_1906756 [Mycena leptocephala]
MAMDGFSAFEKTLSVVRDDDGACLPVVWSNERRVAGGGVVSLSFGKADLGSPCRNLEVATSMIEARLAQLNFEDYNAQRKLRLELEGLKITLPGCSMDLTAICEAKTTLKAEFRELSSPSMNTLTYAVLSLGTLLGTRKARRTLREVA